MIGKENKQHWMSVRKPVFLIPLIIIYCFIFSILYFYVAGLVYGRGHYPWKPYTSTLLNPQPKYLPGTAGPTLFSTNHKGFRGDDPDDADCLILVLGGSTTEGYYLDNTKTWPQVMTDILNKEGIFGKVVAANAAKAGLRLRHNSVQVQELLPELKKTRLVIFLLGPNDVVNFLRNPYSSDVGLSSEIYSAAFSHVSISSSPWSQELIATEYDYIKSLAKSQTLRLLFKLRVKKQSSDSFPQDNNGATYVERRQRRMVALKIDLPAELMQKLDERLISYKSCLREMVESIINSGATPVLITHPINYSSNMTEEQKQLWWTGELRSESDGNGSNVFLTEKAMADLLERFNQALRDLTIEYKNSIILIDLAEILRSKTGLYYDSWHFNIAGAEKAGEIVADAIIKNHQELKKYINLGSESKLK